MVDFKIPYCLSAAKPHTLMLRIQSLKCCFYDSLRQAPSCVILHREQEDRNTRESTRTLEYAHYSTVYYALYFHKYYETVLLQINVHYRMCHFKIAIIKSKLVCWHADLYYVQCFGRNVCHSRQLADNLYYCLPPFSSSSSFF